MRKIPSIGARAALAIAEFDSQSHSHISPPPPPVSHTERCDAKNCPWWPYSSSKEFKANTALIIAVLFCALICALAFNAGIRYIVRLYCGERRSGAAEEVRGLSYAEGMKLGGEETECIICLGDFAVGEKIRVLDKCKHGFHLNCIQRWLISHSSCPTCRTDCSSTSPP